MSGQYERWLANPDARQILEGHNAHALNEDQQTAFERLVNDRWKTGRLSVGGYQRLLRSLVPPVKNSREAGFLVASFKAAIRDREVWGGGQDPHVFEGQTHRKGVDGPNYPI